MSNAGVERLDVTNSIGEAEVNIDSQSTAFLLEEDELPESVDCKYWTRREEWIWGTVIFILTTLNFACRNTTPISAVTQASEYNWDKSEEGLVLSCFYWGYVSAQILSGFLSDRIGGHEVITTAAIGWGLLTIAYPTCADISYDKSSQLSVVVASRILFALLQSFHYPAIASVVARKVHIRNRSFMYTSIGSGTIAGIIISGSFGSLMLDRLGWRSVYYFFGTITVVFACMSRIILLKKKCLHPCRKKDIPVQKNSLLSMKASWKILLSHKAFW
ncbi:voltage-gated purine nucleotide uniporter SLC17A9-like [Saccoglossus kowalevskii]